MAICDSCNVAACKNIRRNTAIQTIHSYYCRKGPCACWERNIGSKRKRFSINRNSYNKPSCNADWKNNARRKCSPSLINCCNVLWAVRFFAYFLVFNFCFYFISSAFPVAEICRTSAIVRPHKWVSQRIYHRQFT